MEDLGKIWRNLGANTSPTPEPAANNEDIERKINDVQSELYGTIDALVSRVRALEQQVAELKVEFAETPSKEFTNAFDLMSPEELLGRKPQPITPLDDEDVIRVKGFVAPAPSYEKVQLPAEEEEEEELSLPDDESALSGVDPVNLEAFDLLDDNDPNHLDASEVITFIESYGGVLNQEMKKKGLLRKDITDKDRKEVYRLLEQCGIKSYKASKFRTFYYIGSESEGPTKYDTYMATK
jgi:hypothetical protein